MSVKQQRLALVTGGTRGIGKAICIALQAAGYKVAANYANNDSKAFEFTNETNIPIYKWDAADEENCKNNVAKIENDFGCNIDILVNNAGIKHDAMFHNMSSEDWQLVTENNLFSCVYMCRAVCDHMRKSGFGRIVNIASVNGLRGQVGQTNYAASKAGMIGFSKSLALELAAKGVTVNAIAPGYVRTDMVDSIPSSVLEKILTTVPIKRLGEPEEIARCVLFLVADEAGFIVGSTLSVNGGCYIY